MIIFPENFDLTHPERCILTIEVSSKDYSFSIYNPIEDGSYFHDEIDRTNHPDAFAAFKDCFYENDFFSLTYRKVFLINRTPAFTFVPTVVFNEKDKEDYFKINFTEIHGKILLQPVQRAGLTILHTIPEDVYDFFSRSFTDVRFVHHLSPLLVYFQDKSRFGNTHKLILNLQSDVLDILCYSSSGEFLFANSFQYKHMNEAVYYILFIWKQFNFNQQKDFIHVAGNSSRKQELMELLQKYIHHVVPVNIAAAGHFAGIDTRWIPFEYLSLTLCEL